MRLVVAKLRLEISRRQELPYLSLTPRVARESQRRRASHGLIIVEQRQIQHYASGKLGRALPQRLARVYPRHQKESVRVGCRFHRCRRAT